MGRKFFEGRGGEGLRGGKGSSDSIITSTCMFAFFWLGVFLRESVRGDR